MSIKLVMKAQSLFFIQMKPSPRAHWITCKENSRYKIANNLKQARGKLETALGLKETAISWRVGQSMF